MLLIFLGVFIAIIIAGVIIYNRTNYDCEWVQALGTVLTVLTIIPTIAVTVLLSQCSVINHKIEICEEMNAQIEEQLDTVVSNYEAYEGKTFSDIQRKSEDGMYLIMMYPELKSDALIQKQMETYEENNKQIRDYKLKKADESLFRWWLYFGK